MAETIKFEYSVYENGKKSPQYTIDSDLAGEITLNELLQFTKTSLLTISSEVFIEEKKRGFPKDPLILVDGSKSKRIENVSPLGKIQFVAKRDIQEIIIFTYQSILDRSPVDTGLYKSYNYVLLNTKTIAKNMTELKTWFSTNPQIDDKDLFMFVNVAPYARRLERLGVSAGRHRPRQVDSKDKHKRSGDRVAAPNGTYFLASKSVRRKYKNNLKIAFAFIPGSSLGINTKFKTPSTGNRGKVRKPSTYLYPSIRILVEETGIL